MLIRKNHRIQYQLGHSKQKRLALDSYFNALWLFVLLVIACDTPSKTNEVSPFIGLNTPVILTDTTVVIWSDYVWEPKKLEVGKLPEGISHIRFNEERSLFIGKLRQPVELIELLIDFFTWVP